jgi:hypothetical protein
LHFALLSALPEPFALKLLRSSPTTLKKKRKKEMGRYLMCLFTTALRRTRKQHGI